MLLYLLALIGLCGAAGDDECKTKYRCFRPDGCTENTLLQPTTGNIDANCFMVLKIHPYATDWFRIILESRRDNTTKIEIIDDGSAKVLFTCEKDGEKVKAKYDTTVVTKIVNFSVSGNLNCEFEVDRRSNNQADTTKGLSLENIRAVVHTNGISNRTEVSSILAGRFCSPSAIFSQDLLSPPSKHYEKAKPYLGAVSCSPKYTKEFREDGSDTYTPLLDMYCKGGGKYALVFDGAPERSISSDDDIDVRCAAEATNFCDYTPKGSKKLEKTNNIMKCPEGHYFEITGQGVPVKGAVIECLNHRGKMKWTFNKTIILSENGPEVQCVDKLQCHKKIPASSLKRSFLNEQFFPTCQGDVKVNVTDVNVASTHATVDCDFNEGEYFYMYKDVNTGKHHKRTVTSTTEFWCFYTDEQAIKNKQAKMTLIYVAAGGSVGFVIFAIAFGAVWVQWNKKKLNARITQVKNRKIIDNSEVYDLEKAEVDAQAPNDANAEANLNDYLLTKRAKAKATVVVSVLPEAQKIKCLKRGKEDFSPELDKLDGKRPGGVFKFVNHKMELTEMMQNITKQAKLRRVRVKALIATHRVEQAMKKSKK